MPKRLSLLLLAAVALVLSVSPATPQVVPSPRATFTPGAGSVTAPSIKFPNGSGFYQLDANTICLTDGAAPRFCWQMVVAGGASAGSVQSASFQVFYSFNGMANASGNLQYSFGVPTINSGFGASPSILTGGTLAAFRVNVGTGGAATSGVINTNVTATNGWNCQVADQTTNVSTRQSASTTTTVTLTGAAAWTASDILLVNCTAF